MGEFRSKDAKRAHRMPPKEGEPTCCQECLHHNRPACKSDEMKNCTWRRGLINEAKS